MVVQSGKRNSRPNILSRIDLWEDTQRIEDTMLDVQLFRLRCVPSDLEYIIVFLKISVALDEIKELERKQLAIHVAPYMLISGDLYKLVRDEFLCQCILEHDHVVIIEESHGGIVGGNTM